MRFTVAALVAVCVAAAAGSGVVSYQQQRHFDSWVVYQNHTQDSLDELTRQRDDLAAALQQQQSEHRTDLDRIDELAAQIADAGDADVRDAAGDRTWKATAVEAAEVIALQDDCIRRWVELEPALTAPERFADDSITAFRDDLDDVCRRAEQAREQWLDALD